MVDRKQIKMVARQQLQGKWGIAIGTYLVAMLILSASSSVFIVGQLILTGVITAGLAIVYLEIVRGWPCNFEDMFKGFSNFGPTCVAGILIGIYTFLWSLLLIIPGIIKSLSYSMTYYILADHPEMSSSDAIAASEDMMHGHKWELFVLELSFIGWIILSLFTFGLLMIFYVIPYMQATSAAFYEAIKAQNFQPPQSYQSDNVPPQSVEL